MLKVNELNDYCNNGWVVLRNVVSDSQLEFFFKEFNTLLSLAFSADKASESSLNHSCDLNLLIKIAESRRDMLSAVYRTCRHLSSLQALLLNDYFLSVARSAMQTNFINICPYTATRIDIRGEEQYLFDWHQDYHYIQGSMNGVVLWIPLCELEIEGTVEVLNGSHKAGLQMIRLIDPENKNKNGAKTMELILNEQLFEKFDAVRPSVKMGDVLFFSTLLIHRSLPQTSKQVRVTTQIRYSDFRDGDAIKRGWPVGLLEGRGFEMDHPEYIFK